MARFGLTVDAVTGFIRSPSYERWFLLGVRVFASTLGMCCLKQSYHCDIGVQWVQLHANTLACASHLAAIANANVFPFLLWLV